MVSIKKPPVPIGVPEEAALMTPKQIILLMRSFGVGKENYEPPHHARPWSSSEFLLACGRDDVMRLARKDPPERTTIEGWFRVDGPLPDDRRPPYHYFYHVFFAHEFRAFGTQEWKKAYFDAVDREKIDAASTASPVADAFLPLEELEEMPVCDILPILRGAR